MSTTTGSHRARLAVLAFAALLLGACGASGGDEVAGGPGASTTTAPTGDGSTTTDPEGDDRADPDQGDPSDPVVDVAALEALLPDAAAIGPDFDVKAPDPDEADDGEDTAADKAMEEACPDAAAYFAQFEKDDGDDAEAKRTYEDSVGRQVEISLDPTVSKLLTPSELSKAVGLFNTCGEISYEEDGATTRMTIRAEEDDSVVDQALVLHMHVVVEAPMLPAPLDVNLKGILYVVDQVGVSVMMIDGLDEKTMQTVESDWDRLYEIAGQLHDPVVDLVGG